MRDSVPSNALPVGGRDYTPLGDSSNKREGFTTESGLTVSLTTFLKGLIYSPYRRIFTRADRYLQRPSKLEVNSLCEETPVSPATDRDFTLHSTPYNRDDLHDTIQDEGRYNR